MQIHRRQQGIRLAAALGMVLTTLWQASAPTQAAQAGQRASAPTQAARPAQNRPEAAVRAQQAPIVTVASVKGLSRTNYDTQNQCAILTDGQVLCWGRNYANELSSTSGIVSVPVTLTGVSDAVDISGSDSRICILHENEMVSCVGANRGAFGDGTDTDSTTLVTVTEYLGGPQMGGIKDFDTNYEFSCAVMSNGTVRCWGWAIEALGAGYTTTSYVPVTVTGITNAVQVALTVDAACAALASGNVQCWGFKDNLGIGATENYSVPVTVLASAGGAPLDGIVELSGGSYNVCGRTAAGEQYCWGGFGSAGNGTPAAIISYPTRAQRIEDQTDLSGVEQIVGADADMCARLTDGTVRCWGSNALGQVGVGNRDAYTRAVTVTLGTGKALTDVVELGNSSDQYCARTSTGNVYCWGQGKFGEIGNGLITDSLRATLVIALQAPAAGPTLLSVRPAANTSAAPLNSSIALTYSAALNASTVTSRTIAVHSMFHGLVTVTHSVAGNVATIIPAKPFLPGELVWNSATTAVQNITGVQQISSTVWQFNTAAPMGHGRFDPNGVQFGVGSDFVNEAWGDFDGDGDLDLALGLEVGQDGVYINDGSGHFPISVTFGTGSDTTDSVAWGDFDNDGDLDLAVGNWGEQNYVYLNNGNGTFDQNGVPFGAPFGAITLTTKSLAWGDANGDGFLDIAVANESGPSIVYLNDGNGAFDPNGVIIGTSNDSDRSMAWGDFNNDGAIDLAVANINGQSAVYVNDGTGHFPITVPVGASTAVAMSMAWGDMNGDGDLDLAMGTAYSGTVFQNNGDGTFGAGVTIGTGNVYSMIWGDVDGDGDLDLAMSDWKAPNAVYLNDGAGHFPVSITVGTGADSTLSMAWGDADGDGDLDLAIGNFKEPNVVYLNAAVLSPDASLSALTINPGTLAPAFVSNTNNYTAEVPNGTTSVMVTATTNDAGASVAYASSAGPCGIAARGAFPTPPPGAPCEVAGPKTWITATVTAADESTREYSIEITFAAPPSSDLTIGNVWPKTGVPAGLMPVSLFGHGFTGVFSVTVGGKPLASTDFTVRDDGRIDIHEMPAGENFTYVDFVVTGTNGSATAAQAFLYINLSAGEVPASGGVITTASGATITVPALGSSFVLTYTPVAPPIPPLGNVLMHVFRLDALLNWIPVSEISQPITIELPVDPSIVPNGERPWLYVFVPAAAGKSESGKLATNTIHSSSAGMWSLVPGQRYNPATMRVTVRLSRMETYALSTLVLHNYYVPQVGPYYAQDVK